MKCDGWNFSVEVYGKQLPSLTPIFLLELDSGKNTLSFLLNILAVILLWHIYDDISMRYDTK